MATRADVVNTARSYLGVRFHHQGRTRAGLDCAGLVVRVAHDLGLSTFDHSDYGPTPLGNMMRGVMDRETNPVAVWQPGDILMMSFVAEPQHLAIVTDHGVIHALLANRKVVEHRLDAVWASRIVCAYSYKGIE